MGICSGKPADSVPIVAVKAVNPVTVVGSRKDKSSINGGNGNGSNYRISHVADQDTKSSISSTTDQDMKSSMSSTTVVANGSSAELHKNSPAVGKIITPNLKTFTYAELRSATRNFRPENVLGEGGFGRVFKGWVDEKTYAPSRVGVGIPVAVKKSNPDSEQGLKEWQAEVIFLGKFSHPNLVKLLGYCREDEVFLLVYEYMQKGSLETHLFRHSADVLSWEIRLKIAMDAARGLAFLHNTEKQVIYRDFKAANILLDGDYNAKLSDFGLAKSGPVDGDTHVSTQVLGTYGYSAPEYLASGHLYVKSDVFGFGAVLLELMTGLRIFDSNRPNGEHNLVVWSRPMLSDKRKLRKLMDSRLEGQYPSKGALQTAQVILKCLETEHKNRPTMEQVLLSLEFISTIKTKPKESKPKHNRVNHRSPLHTKYPSGPTTAPSKVRAQRHATAANSSY